MSLEAKIEELTGAVTALAEIVKSQVAIQERLVAGQAAALEKIEGGKEKATTTRRTRAAKDEPEAAPAPKAEEPAPTASGAEDAASASSEPKKVSFADYAKAWLNSQEQGSAEYKRRGKLLMSILGNFGAGKISEVDEKHHTAAVFFIKRDEAGKPIDFDAEYDFAGDPAQDVEDDDAASAFDD